MQMQRSAQRAKQDGSLREYKSLKSPKPCFDDARPEMAAQMRMQSLMANSPQVTQMKAVRELMDTGVRAKHNAPQDKSIAFVRPGPPPLQRQSKVIQCTLKDALHYYQRVTGDKVTRKQDVDKSKLSKGQKAHFTRLENQGASSAGAVGVRKVGSSSGAGRYRLKSPQQIRVRYGSTKARFVRSERKSRHVKGKYSGYNYATAKVILTNKTNGNKKTIYITRGSQDGSTHSEGAIKDVIKMLQRIHVVSVDWVYTEREACGPDNQNCRGKHKLGDHGIFGANVTTYYSVDWPDSAEKGTAAKDARKQGTNLLKRMDTQVGKATGIHHYANQTSSSVHASESYQEEDAGMQTSDDESSDESDILHGGYEGARRSYKELS